MDEARSLVDLPAAELPRLLGLAHEVRRRWWGEGVELESLISAQTGGCQEDCAGSGSQSMHHDAPAQRHAFLPLDQVLAAARATEESGASAFCIVVAVRGPDRRLMDQVLRAIEAIHAETGLHVELLARHPHPPAGRGPPGRRRSPLQPQPRGRAQLLRRDRHHPHLGGARRDAAGWYRAGHQALQRRHPRDGGDLGAAARARLRAARAGARRDPAQLPEPPAGDAARRAAAPRGPRRAAGHRDLPARVPGPDHPLRRRARAGAARRPGPGAGGRRERHDRGQLPHDRRRPAAEDVRLARDLGMPVVPGARADAAH